VILLDVNVLVYACRKDASRHAEFRRWLLTVLGGTEPVGIASETLAAVVRIVTSDRIWKEPLRTADALAFCDAVRAAPATMLIEAGEGHWELFRAMCRDGDARGNLVADARLAALALEQGSVLMTTDRDFARFPRLRWRDPLSA
jgi:toxin-antitoxin system PIN domain toxin